LVQLPENQKKEGLGFSTHKTRGTNPAEGTFLSAEFINAPPEINVIVKDQPQEEAPAFVTPGGICWNWVAADIPFAIPLLSILFDFLFFLSFKKTPFVLS